MDLQLEHELSQPVVRHGTRSSERDILVYWGISTVLGVFFLWDWLSVWNVGATLRLPWLLALLVATFTLSQVLYVVVAHHDGRPIRWGPTMIFTVGNGICETLSFALVYRLGELIGSSVMTMVAPSAASGVGFALGVVFFCAYGGLIHGLFWLRLLPPHLNDSPRSRTLRKFRPLAEVVLVLSWSLCLYLTRDIWTVVFVHLLVDFGLMLRVRPPLFVKK